MKSLGSWNSNSDFQQRKGEEATYCSKVHFEFHWLVFTSFRSNLQQPFLISMAPRVEQSWAGNSENCPNFLLGHSAHIRSANVNSQKLKRLNKKTFQKAKIRVLKFQSWATQHNVYKIKKKRKLTYFICDILIKLPIFLKFFLRDFSKLIQRR